MHPCARKLIDRFGLLSHPEGGYFRENYRAPARVTSSSHNRDRSAFTSIYFLLDGSQYSAWHRVASDESWFFHTGTDLEIMTLKSAYDTSEKSYLTETIGPNSDRFELTVPAGTWFAAKPADPSGFTLVSCVVGPGFEFEDFELATQAQLAQEGYAERQDWSFIKQFLAGSR